PSINIEELDAGINSGEIACELVEDVSHDTVMTNSFGFGGTNGSMLLSRYYE
ncbi:MAG: beta-ketoacyl-ACP synthase I, partial [Rhodobacteraceae bacterium]|nr:beta-ketoacyl-ACP synthase I [Paracoccaceae bacterium]